jgi:hypothetical protein
MRKLIVAFEKRSAGAIALWSHSNVAAKGLNLGNRF